MRENNVYQFRTDKIPRIRTVAEIVAECKSIDPNTQVSEYFVRNAITEGFPVIKTGWKFLINIDLFIEYLNGTYELRQSN